MKLIALLSWLIIVQANVVQEEVLINGVRHEKEILFDNRGPFHFCRLAIDYTTNDLYFGSYFCAKLNVNTRELKIIQGVNHCSAVAVDQETHDVYVGGLDGVYKYNVTTNNSERVGTNGENSIVWRMFFKKALYYVALPSNYVYKFINGQSTKFEALDRKVDNFVIDSKDVMYFNYNSHFYRQDNGMNGTATIRNIPYVRALNTDKNGKVYACSYDGIYKAIAHSATFLKVVDIKDASGIVFDRDNNMIYSDETRIIRLKPKHDSSTVTSQR